MKNLIKTIISLAIILIIVFIFRVPIRERLRPLANRFHIISDLVPVPCGQPVLYSLGTFDTGFNISQADFLSALTEAEAIWEKQLNIDLFAYDPLKGDLKVNLIYDFRQEATDKLKSLGIAVKNDQATYNLLQTEYNNSKVNYARLKIEYDRLLAEFKNSNDTYQQQVTDWNKKGGAPQKEYSLLEAERISLVTKSAELQNKQTAINELISEINSLVVVLNRLGTSLNLTAEKNNTIGASRGETFEEAVYRSDGSSQEIDIYEFNNRASLIRVLAHELGHALGIVEHATDPKAIMYAVNTDTNFTLAAEDIEALKAICELD